MAASREITVLITPLMLALLVMAGCADSGKPPLLANNGANHGANNQVNNGVQPVETECADGLDNDGDRARDCDDTDCAGDPACSVTGEDCDDGEDDDLDGDVDCADSDCRDEPHCQQPDPEDCTDRRDNDNDGSIDCDDQDCAADPACSVEGDCADGIDGDGDGDVDCADADCQGDPACGASEDCADGVDNDDDGAVDCADVDCAADPDCDPSAEVCDDGIDNDDDGDVDCADADCAGDPACGPDPENCTDGADNDGDGDTDCADADCARHVACTQEVCDDGVDNDGDGDVDCADSDCDDDPACGEVCDDGSDNDGDGNIDCADADCVGQPGCIEVCDDNVDNDADGDVDCADADCAGSPGCREICNDGADNDLDGDADCADADCLGVPACREVCDDGIDNDLNGDTDCADIVCDGVPECAPCGNGDLDPGEQCDDDNQVDGDGCNALCFEERVDANVGGQFDGALPRDGLITYFLTVHNAPTRLHAQTSDGNGGCPSGDTILDVFDVTNGRDRVATNDDGGDGLCSRIDRDLGPGQYEVVVRSFLNRGHGGYVLDVEVHVNVNAGGDFSGGFAGGQWDLYRFARDAQGPLRAWTSDGADGCPGDTEIVLSSIGDDELRTEVVRDNDGGVDGCSALSLESLPAGRYEMLVQGVRALDGYQISVAYTPEPFCGDGNVDDGEECDDGNNEPGDRCDPDCNILPFCGDGNLDEGEACDDGNNEPGDRCDADCNVEPYCGDGTLDDGEECDDGGEVPGDGCDAECQFEQGCGNGTVDGNEQCDDDNIDNGDGCNSACFDERVDVNNGGRFRSGFAADGASVFLFTVENDPTQLALVVDDGEAGCADLVDPTMSVFRIVDGDRVAVVADDNGGVDLCPRIDAAVGPGDYEIVVRDTADHGIPEFFLGVDIHVDVNAGGDFQGGFAASGHDLFRFTLEAGIEVVLETGDGQGGCPGGDTTMGLFPFADGEMGDRIAYDDDGGPGLCSRLVRVLDAGTYQVEVRGFNNRANTGYVLSVDIRRPVCGNGDVEGDEQCDDGGTENGDGCNALCLHERVDINVDGAYRTGFPADVATVFFFAVDIDPTQAVLTVGDGNGGCAVEQDPYLSLFRVVDGERTLVVADDNAGQGNCAAIAASLEPGDYEVELRDVANLSIPRLFLDVEIYVAIDAGGAFAGGFPAGESDAYRFDLDADTAIELFTGDGQGGCPGDTTMTLYSVADNGDRTQLTYNDDGGNGLCSRIQSAYEAGSYEVVVRGYSGRAIPAYVLTAEIPYVP